MNHRHPSSSLPGPYVILQGSAGDGMANLLMVPPHFDFDGTDNDGVDDVCNDEFGTSDGGLGSVLEVEEEALVESNNNTRSDDTTNNNNLLWEDDTEGGLHLPLGSTSPIMKKLCHRTAYSLSGVRPPSLDIGTDTIGDELNRSKSSLSPRPTAFSVSQSPTVKSSTSKTNAATSSFSNSKPSQLSVKLSPTNHQWLASRREAEMHSYEETHQNIRAVVTQRRKQLAASTKTNASCSRPPSSARFDAAMKQLDHVEEMVELAKQHRSWYQINGKLVVFQTLPHTSLNGVVTHPVQVEQDGVEEIVTLPPGNVVYATEIIVLDSRTLRPVDPLHDTNDSKTFTDSNKQDDTTNNDDREYEPKIQHPDFAEATIQLMKITSPYIGYIVSHLHGYPYLAPGSPLDYVPNYKSCDSTDETISWMWRVVYQPDGAFVREGAELISDQVGTLPYGSFCTVQEKIINDMGLSRLKIHAHVKECYIERKEEERAEKSKEEGEWREISGWTSLFINPLSGNTGKIIEPVNFPVPVLYKVICEKGAVIRTGIEVSTSEVGIAQKGSILSIVGRAFSDHPRSSCIERLKLAGERGWISSRLTSSFSEDRRIVELVGLDESFDPFNPVEFHYKSHKKAMSEITSTMNKSIGKMKYPRQLSEINDESSSDQEQSSLRNEHVERKQQTIVSTTTLFQNGMPASVIDHAHPNRCLICLSDERTATIVHGETGHIACCLTCARILKARGDTCPVCRESIDAVIQHFWA